MTDPRETRQPPHDRVPLEPWALDLLDREPESDPRAREELAKVVALLRNLPDLEPPAHLVEDVLARAANQHGPFRVLGVLLDSMRRMAPPAPVALAMAAGVAGLIAFTPPTAKLTSFLSGDEPSVRTMDVAQMSGSQTSRPTPTKRRPTAVVRPQFVSLFPQVPTTSPHLRFDRPLEEPFDTRLDRQINQLMIDPTAFAERLERVAQRDQFMARLADRAAQRGDAPEVAMRVRQSSHPLALQLVNRLLTANYVASVSPH